MARWESEALWIGRDADGEFSGMEYDLKCLLKYAVGTKLYIMQVLGGGFSLGCQSTLNLK